MTLTSILRPAWLSYHLPPSSSAAILSRSLGLHQSCVTTTTSGKTTTTCRPFPTASDCAGDGEAAFCAMWRTVGWLASLAAVLELAALVAVAAVLAGGRARREGQRGWAVVVGLMGAVGMVLFAGMGIVVSFFYFPLPTDDGRATKVWCYGDTGISLRQLPPVRDSRVEAG